MAIWLKVWASDEYDDVHFAVVDATPMQVGRWLACMDIAGELKKDLGGGSLSPRCLEFEDESVTFYECVEGLGALMEEVSAEELVVVGHSVELPAHNVVPQEITRLVATPDEVYWRSYRESVSTIMITAIIPRTLLETAADYYLGT